MYRTLKSPLSVQVEITEACSNRCRHCYNSFRHEDAPLRTMTRGEIDILVSEFEQGQVLRGVVTGGEPLMVPNLAIYLLGEMRRIGMGVAINTNLTQFSRKIGERLQKIGISAIMTSLVADTPEIHDYVTQRSGSFEKTSQGIQLAVEMGFRVLVNMVLTSWNISRIRQTGDLVGSWGVAKFGATRATAPIPIADQFRPHLISLEELRESLVTLYELKERWGYEVDVYEHYPWCALRDIDKYRYLARRGCTAGIISATIGADGQLRPCGHNTMTYGSVFKQGLEKPWLAMDDWRRQDYSQDCQSCPYFDECTGGCPVEAKTSPNGCDHHCTGPEDVIPPQPKGRRDVPSVSGSFVFAEETILRKEPFGGSVGSGFGGVTLVDEATFGLLESMARLNEFTLETLIDQFQVDPEEGRLFLGRLVTQTLVRRTGKEVD